MSQITFKNKEQEKEAERQQQRYEEVPRHLKFLNSGPSIQEMMLQSENRHEQFASIRPSQMEIDAYNQSKVTASLSLDDPAFAYETTARIPNEFIHRVISYQADQTHVSNETILKYLSQELKSQVSDVAQHIVSNRWALARNVTITVVSSAMIAGIYTASIPSFPLIGTGNALYIMGKTLGLEAVIVRRINQLIEKHPRVLEAKLHKFPVPRFMQPWLKERGLDKKFDVTIGEIMDRMMVEGVRYMTFKTWYAYMLSAILPGIIYKTASLTNTAACHIIGQLRYWSRYSGFEAFHAQLIDAVQSTWDNDDDDDDEKKQHDSLSMNDLARIVDQSIQPAPPPEAGENRFIAAAALGTTLTVGLVTGQLVEPALHLIQNEMVRGMAFTGLVQASSFDQYIIQLGLHYTKETIDKIKSLRASILDKRTRADSPSLIQHFFGLILGEQIYSKEMIEKLSKAQLLMIIQNHGILTTHKDPKRMSEHQLREMLTKHQQDVLQTTHQQMLMTFTKYALETATVVTLANGIASIYEVVNSPTLATEAGLTKDEIKVFNQVDPELETDIMADTRANVAEKVNTYLNDHPEVVLVLQEGQLAPDVTTHVDDTHRIRAIRAERHERRIAYEQDRIHEYAAKYKLLPEQTIGITKLGELQALIHERLANTQTNTQTQAMVGVTTATQYGTVREETLIPRALHEEFKEMTFTDLYTTLKRRAATAAFTHPILNYINSGVDVINYGKNTYNLGLAFNRLTGYGTIEGVTEHLPYAPTTNLRPILDAAQFVNDYIVTDQPRNVYDVFLTSMKHQISTANFDVRDFATDIAGQVVGTDRALDDMTALAKHNLIAILLGYNQDVQ